MKRTNKELDAVLNRVTAGIRDEAIDPEVVRSAADRVLKRLSSEESSSSLAAPAVNQIRGCADFQSLIPSYLDGSLSSARSLLFEDHTHECVPCRKALKQQRTGNAAAQEQPAAARPSIFSGHVRRWAIAATVIVALLASTIFYDRVWNVTRTFHAIASEINGPVYLLSDSQSRAIAAGDKIDAGEKVRVAKDAGAVVRLPDGSMIETKERSEFSVSETASGVTIHLDRGNIIVQAAKNRKQPLYVSTSDCTVSVTGTIFSVNNGTKGSRVSVIEGQVNVDHAGEKHILRPGDQISTNPSINAVPVKDEVAWSRDRDRYSKMLEDLRNEIDTNVERPGVRYSTRLLDLAPEGTVLYAAIPNLTHMLTESHRIIEQRIAENAALREWWEKDRASATGRRGFDQAIEEMGKFGDYLGDEIVVCAQMDNRGEPGDPLVLASLKDAAAFRAYLESKNIPGLRIVDDASAIQAQGANEKSRPEFFILIHNDLLAASPKADALGSFETRMKASAASRFNTSAFHSRIAELYQEGAGLIVAADLEKIMAGAFAGEPRNVEAYRRLGLTSLKHFIVEVKEQNGKSQNRAVLSFNDASQGIASWLAAPGPMGALEFISPDANIVAAFVVKQPVALVDDLISALGTVDPDLQKHLDEFERETGLNIRNDFAAPLGGEFAFAIDGPLLPTPSWKVVFEVYDAAHLQQTFERVVERLNQYAAKEGKAGFQWERVEIGGRTFYTLRSVDLGVEMSYAYVNGYLVAAPSRALIDRAIRYNESGYTLSHSPRFIAALPEDRNANFSAVVYQNIAPVVSSIAKRVGRGDQEQGSPGHALKTLAEATPVLAYAYAQGDRIIVSANNEKGPIGLSPSSLVGMPGSFGLRHILGGAMRE